MTLEPPPPITFPNERTRIAQSLHVCMTDDGPDMLPGLETPDPAPVPAFGICWACGAHRAPRREPGQGPTYCTRCSSAGEAQPWINCSGCGVVRKRTRPGEREWVCASCRA